MNFNSLHNEVYNPGWVGEGIRILVSNSNIKARKVNKILLQENPLAPLKFQILIRRMKISVFLVARYFSNQIYINGLID